MNLSELNEILQTHCVWTETYGANGRRANLCGANLRGALYEDDITEQERLKDSFRKIVGCAEVREMASRLLTQSPTPSLS